MLCIRLSLPNIKNMNATQDIAGSIALEAHALEHAITSGVEEYRNTPALQGKSWFAIGLEFNETETAVDEGNKSGVIHRMVEAIRKFIQRIVAHIQQFLGGGTAQKAEQRAEALKNYKGPTKEQLIKVAEKVIKTAGDASEEAKAAISKAQKSSAVQVNGEADAAADKELPQDLMEAAFARASMATGAGFTRKEAVDAFMEEKITGIESRLGSRLDMFVRSLEEEFHSAFDSASKIANSLRKVSIDHIQGVVDDAAEMVNAVKRCYEAASSPAGKRSKTIENFVYGVNTQVVHRAVTYAHATFGLEDVTKFIESLETTAKSLQNETSEEAVNQLQAVQKIISNLTAYVGLATKLEGMHKAAYDVLTA